MNRYIHAGVGAAIGLVKMTMIKVQRGNAFHAPLVHLISPGTEITVDQGGRLTIGKLMKMRGGSKLRVRKGGVVSIGNHFSMGNHCMITAHESIVIGDEVQFGPNVYVYDHDHDYRAAGGLAANQFKTSPVEIGNNVWIGANTVILRGTKIGDNCVVGAGCVLKGNYRHDSLIIQKRETTVRPMADE